MEIKTAFSSQFNHDAAIRDLWCTKHVAASIYRADGRKREEA